MNIGVLTFVLFVTAALNVLVGLLVYRRNPRGPVHRFMLLTTALIAFWSVCIGLTWVVRGEGHLLLCGRLAHAASLLVCTACVNLVLVYPGGRSQISAIVRGLTWGTGLSIAIAAIFTPWVVAHARVVHGDLQPQYGPLRYLYALYIAFCLIWLTADLLLRLRRLRGVRRLQVEYVLMGQAAALALALPSNVIAPLFGLHGGVWVGPLLSFVFIGFVAHAIVRHRLMGMRVFIAHRVAEGLTVGIAGVLFAGLFWMADTLGRGLSHPGIGFIAFAVALLLQPIRAAARAGVARYLYRPPYDYQSTVRDASRTLAATLDAGRALDYILETVGQTLQVEQSLVLIADRRSHAFRVRAAKVWGDREGKAPANAGLAETSPLALHVGQAREPVVREELEHTLPAEKADAIAAEMLYFGADVAVPLLSGNALLGIWLVGARISGDVFGSQDIDLLATLGAESAATIANSQLHEEAMQSDRLATIGGLAAGIAHEVKNPLVAVRTFAEMLPDSHDDPEFTGQFSKLVLSEVDRIDSLIRQLLNYARPAPAQLERVDLNAISRETLELLNYEAQKQDVRLVQSLAPDLPMVMADASQLRQVVVNIALNAIQAMPEGGLLRATTRFWEGRARASDDGYLLPDQGMVALEIANSGPPIPEASIEAIFEPFFSTRSDGTGLGLPICKRIVDEHHGQIRVMTTEDGLTAFVVQLPAAAGQDAFQPAGEAPHELVGAGKDDFR